MTDLSLGAHLVCGFAAVGAGAVNAVAGGGTLVSFPIMTAVGVPAVTANASNTVALCPGYIGGAHAQRADLAESREQLRPLLVTAAVGGLTGSILLASTSEAAFRALVPYLISLAAVVLALQPRLRALLLARRPGYENRLVGRFAVGAASVYGGYFGAGLGIMLLAILGLLSDLPFNRLNAVKQALSIVVNVSAAAFLAFSGRVDWTIIAVMAPASLLGGHAGGRLFTVLSPRRTRAGVVVFAFIVAIVYLTR